MAGKPSAILTWLPVLLVACALASCAAEQRAEPDAPQPLEARNLPESHPPRHDGAALFVLLTPGEAGGTAEEVVKLAAVVSAIDPVARTITLSTPDGFHSTFTAPESVRGFDRIRAGDAVSATLVTRLVVQVVEGPAPAELYAAAPAPAPGRGKPGAFAGESFEIVAVVTSVDPASRRATLQFAGGQTRTVPIRRDVHPSKYRVGDSVVIRVTQELTLAEPPLAEPL